MADLTRRRDRTDIEFLALSLALISATLVEVPCHLLNLEKPQVEAMAKSCSKVSKQKMTLILEVRKE